MQSEQESFEEMQARHTGRSPGAWRTLTLRVKRINWLKVILPAAFLAIPLALVIRDLIGESLVAPEAFAAIYLVIFLAAALFIAAREGARTDRRHKTDQ